MQRAVAPGMSEYPAPFPGGTDAASRRWRSVPRPSVWEPYLWGLGAFGEAGVERVLAILRAEIRIAMQQLGAPSLKDLVPAMVRRV
jgi:4-hydroxymandelate oxidase